MGIVNGSIVSTQKHESLVGKKLMIVAIMDSNKDLQEEIIAVDSVGAGIGEYVLLTQGGSARRVFSDGETIDCAIVGIIDSFEK